MIVQQFHVDLERVLTPISSREACGPFVRNGFPYDAIREARRQDDGFDQGAWTTTRKKPDWAEVTRLSLEALYEQTKDLRIAASLLESLSHQHGLAGVAEGMSVLVCLCDAFWDSIHPGGPEGDDAEARVAVFEWINERLPIELRLLPLTMPAGAEHRAQTFDDYERALRLQNGQRQDPRQSRGKPKAESSDFQATVTATPVHHFRDLESHAAAAVEQCDALTAILDRTLGTQAPSLMGLRDMQVRLQAWLRNAIGARPVEAIEPAGDPSLTSGDVPAEAFELPFDSVIRSRWEAYRMLSDAAEFLSRTEPHSPVPYLVRRAILWGSMNLEELLGEVIRNDAERKEVFRLLQIEESRSSR
jgi:type VI secretion system ImpA family protein